jgi:hypothetical protein
MSSLCGISLQIARQQLFPVLFSEKSSCVQNYIIGIRMLRIILDPKSKFLETCGWSDGSKVDLHTHTHTLSLSLSLSLVLTDIATL